METLLTFPFIKVNKREKVMKLLKTLYKKIMEGGRIGPDEALKMSERYSWEELAPYSERLRQLFFGNRVSLCAIVNAKSGDCDMNCSFCSQNAESKTEITRYPLANSRRINEAIRHAEASKADRFGVVTSGGRLSSREIRQLGEALDKLENRGKTKLCVSLGRLKQRDLSYLRSKGVNRIHHNLETSEAYYGKICTTQSWESRVETIRQAMAAGFQVCAGGLFGLGESWSDRISLALSLRNLNVRNIPINFFTPHKGTKLAAQPVLEPCEALKIIALYRFFLPDATLRICGGRRLILGEDQSMIFKAGANAIMTGDYLTTTGNLPAEDKRMIEASGLKAVRNE